MIDLERLFKPLRTPRLKDYERAQMRASLITFMRENPLKPSAWRVFLKDMAYLALSMRVHPVVTAFVVVLCVATGTSYAAETALPGEALYAIKTNVNEKAVGAFAVSHAEKVEWGARLTDRRLSEAEQLEVEGRLTPVAAASIQSGLAEATKSFDDSALADAADQSDTGITDALSDLQASLQAHGHVLSALQSASSTDSTAITEILQTVHSRAKGVADGRSKSGKRLSIDQSDKFRDVVSAKKLAAEAAVKTLHDLAASAKDSFGEETSDGVTVGALQAAERVTTGSKRFSQGDYSGALGSYQAAIRAAKETKMSLDAAKLVRKSLRPRRESPTQDSSRSVSVESAIQTQQIVQVAADAQAATMDAPASLMMATAPARVEPPRDVNRRGKSNDNDKDSDDHDDDSVRVELHF